MRLLQSIYERAAALSIPIQSTVELLAPCNLKCPHCYVTHSKKRALTLPVLEDLFAQMAGAGAFAVTLTGGEIGLRKDLWNIVGAARSHHLAVRLLSSGTLWGEDDWDQIVAHGVQEVRVSLYSLEPRIHDLVTLSEGSFERTMGTIEALDARGIKIDVACPVLAANVASVPDVVVWAEERNMGVVIDPNITMTDRSHADPKTTAASSEQLVALYRNERIRAHFKVGDEACNRTSADKPCSVADYATFIDSEGEVFPCVNWPESGGNIKNTRYLTIWRESPVFLAARGLTLAEMATCNGCGAKGQCSPCAGMNLRERGTLALPSTTLCSTTSSKLSASASFGRSPARAGLPILT